MTFWQTFYDHFTLLHLAFEQRLIVVGVVLVVTTILFTSTRFYWQRIYWALIRHPDSPGVFSYKESLRHAIVDLLFVFKVLLIVYILLVGVRTYSQSPYVMATSPKQYQVLPNAAPEIEIEFNLPVATGEVVFHTSPVTEGEWVWQNIFQNSRVSGLSRKVRFKPKASFYPGTEVIIYMVGVRPAWNKSQSHEMSVQFHAPLIPTVKEISPILGAQDVPVHQSLQIAFNSPIGDFVELTYDIQPETEIYQIVNQENVQEIDFLKNLSQNQTYTVNIFRTPRTYRIATGQDLELGDTELIGSTTFKTVAPPFISSFEPQGTAVLPDAMIKVEFDQDMDTEQVAEQLSINPTTSGTLSWPDARTLIFDPEQDLAKDTEYRVSFDRGLSSHMGGVTEQEIEYVFKTIGPVKVAHITPLSGVTGVDPVDTNIVVNFDQEVDHQSAQDHFSITPSVQADFAWDGNTMVYQTSGKLDYSRQYTVSLSPGIRSVRGLDSIDGFSSDFTTKSQIFSLGVPYHRQQEGFTCNIAATRMVLDFRGLSFSESDIKNAIGIGENPDKNWVNGYGVHIDPVASYIGQYRQVAIKRNWNLAELVAEVRKGNPVMVWVYNRYSQPPEPFTLSGGYTGYMGMHSEVVRGFIGDPDNPTHILTNDPWRGQLTYDIPTFNWIWSYINNTALVIY